MVFLVQAIAQVRTVYSFVGEARAVESYSKALQAALKLGYKGSLAKGLGMGTTYGVLFCCWALLLWYAGTLVRSGVTNGGKALSTIFAVIIGGMCVSNFSKPRPACLQEVLVHQKERTKERWFSDVSTGVNFDGASSWSWS